MFVISFYNFSVLRWPTRVGHSHLPQQQRVQDLLHLMQPRQADPQRGQSVREAGSQDAGDWRLSDETGLWGRGLPLAPQLPEVPQVSLHLCGVPRDPRQSRPWGRGHHQHWRDGVHLRPSQGLQQDIPCDRAPGGGAAGTAQSTGSRLRTTKALARPPSPSRGSKPDQETRKWNSYLTKVGSCVSGLAKLVEGGTTILKLNTMQIRFVLDFLIFYSLVIFFRSWVPFWLSS